MGNHIAFGKKNEFIITPRIGGFKKSCRNLAKIDESCPDAKNMPAKLETTEYF